MKEVNFNYLSQLLFNNSIQDFTITLEQPFKEHEKLVETIKQSKFKKLNFSGDQRAINELLKYVIEYTTSEFWNGLENICGLDFPLSCKFSRSSKGHQDTKIAHSETLH